MVHSSAWHGYLWVIEDKYKHEEAWVPSLSLSYCTRRAAREAMRNLKRNLKLSSSDRQFRVALYQKVRGRS